MDSPLICNSCNKEIKPSELIVAVKHFIFFYEPGLYHNECYVNKIQNAEFFFVRSIILNSSMGKLFYQLCYPFLLLLFIFLFGYLQRGILMGILGSILIIFFGTQCIHYRHIYKKYSKFFGFCNQLNVSKESTNLRQVEQSAQEYGKNAVLCRYCNRPLMQKDELITAFYLGRIRPYHKKCRAELLKSPKGFFAAHDISLNGTYGNVLTSISLVVVLCLTFILIFKFEGFDEGGVIIVLALFSYPLLLRATSYFCFEKKINKVKRE